MQILRYTTFDGYTRTVIGIHTLNELEYTLKEAFSAKHKAKFVEDIETHTKYYPTPLCSNTSHPTS